MTDPILKLAILEERLLGTWTRRAKFRAIWTPNPREFFSERSQAVAEAAVTVSGVEASDLGTSLVMALAKANRLKLWEPGSVVIHHEDLADPVAALDQWRELRCLIALRNSLAIALREADAGLTLSEVRGRILEAMRASEAHRSVKAWSDGQLMALALSTVTEQNRDGHSTGFTEIDRFTGGLRPGHVWVIGAPTNWGKTSLALAIIDHHQLNSRRAMMVTCEDAPELIATRLLCRRAKLHGGSARDGKLSSDQIDRASDEVSKAAARGDAPILIDGRGRDVEHIAGDIRAAARAHGPGLVLVDYLQCIVSSRDTQDRRGEINHIARTLTDAIKTSGCAGILSSQLTGEDIRESRDVEHAAEVVLIGRKNDSGMQLFVKKNKCGPKDAVIALEWDELNGSFKTEESYDDFGFDDYRGLP